jgi:hypothetical protein
MGINLDKIVQDLLLIIRGSSISQSETISKRQLEDWVHQYRALLLKRDLDKHKTTNPDYIQEIPNLSISLIEGSESSAIGSDCYISRSTLMLPKTIDLNSKSGITYIGTILGNQIQMIPYTRFQWQQYKKYTKGDKLGFLRNQYLYIYNNELLTIVNVRGVFENPLEITAFDGTDYRSNYPLPMDKISILKEMILKGELGIEAKTPSDNTDDSNNKLSANVEQGRTKQ